MHESHAETSSLEAQLVSPKPLQHEALGRYTIHAARQIPPSHQQRKKVERSEDLDRDLVPLPWDHRSASCNLRYLQADDNPRARGSQD